MLTEGTGVTITGSGSAANPYVISGGGSGSVTTTIAGLNAMAAAGSLVVGTKYIVTDWTATPALPGPNLLVLDAMDAHTPSGFVQIATPLGAVGPMDGEFIWNYLGSLNLMVRVRDALGNDVSTVGGTTIGQFPWGDNGVTDNIVRESNLAGLGVGLQVMVGNDLRGTTLNVVAGAIPFQMQNSSLTDSTVNVTNAAASLQIVDCVMTHGDIELLGPGVLGLLQSRFSTGFGVMVTHNGHGTLTVSNCTMERGSITTAVGSLRNLTLESCDMTATTVNYTRTAPATGGNNDTINFSRFQGGTFTWAGATDPGLSQVAGNLTLTNGSTITMTNPNSASPVLQTTVQGQSILTINGGNIANSFLSSGFQLTTNAFTHNQVSCVGGFAQGLSANNTNTYRGFGGNTLV